MSKSSTPISLNTRVFLNKNISSLGTVCKVIIKNNKNKTKSVFYNVSWDKENADDLYDEYTSKQISPIQIQVTRPTSNISEQQELRYQQYAEECRQRGADHIEQERLRTAQLQSEQMTLLQQQQLFQHANHRTQKSSSNKLNRVHNRISNSEINYATSNTTVPTTSLAQPQVDDGSFINQDAVKYEVQLFVICQHCFCLNCTCDDVVCVMTLF
jgi:hypothetical protein